MSAPEHDPTMAPRQPAEISRDLREAKVAFEDPTLRQQKGPYYLAARIQKFQRELQEAREAWIRRVV